jgi:hypothetical protein
MLGGAQIAIVESALAQEQLDSFSSSARLVPICVPMTEAETGFHERLLSYFIRAYLELMRCSNLQQITSSKHLKSLASSRYECCTLLPFLFHVEESNSSTSDV